MFASMNSRHDKTTSLSDADLAPLHAAAGDKDGIVSGQVKWFSGERGYGYISYSESGCEKAAYFTVRDVQYKHLPERGDKVSFRLRVGSHGEEAYDISHQSKLASRIMVITVYAILIASVLLFGFSTNSLIGLFCSILIAANITAIPLYNYLVSSVISNGIKRSKQ